jgi:hypothetical protein
MTKMEKITNRVFDLWVFFILTAIITVIALSHDIFRDIASEADSDFTGIYHALRFNEGLPQTMFGHTGYAYFVILSIWLWILDLLSLVPISKISDLPGPATFEPIWSTLIYAGRSLSIILSILSAVLFYFIAKLISSNRNVAAVIVLLFAVSPGLVRQSLVMHTELPSFVFFLGAVLFALYAERSKPWVEFFYVFLAAFCATLATMSKMQIIPLILALPMVMLMLNAGVRAQSMPLSFRYPLATVAAVVIVSLAVSVPAQVMAWTLVFPALPELQNFSGSGYQVLIAAYLFVIVIVYNIVDRRSYRELLLAFSTISAGIAAAFYLNFLHHSITATDRLVNFVDHMTVYAAKSKLVELGNNSDSDLILKLIAQVENIFVEVIQHNLLDFDVSKWPFSPMCWVLVGSIFYFLALRKWRLFLTITTLLLTAFGMDTFSGFRKFAEHYRIYNEIWFLLGASILLQLTVSAGYWNNLKIFEVRKIVAVSLTTVVFAYTLFGSLDRASGKIKWHDRHFGCGQANGYMPDLINHFCTDKFIKPERVKLNLVN